MQEELLHLAALFQSGQSRIVTAESCTGGMLGALFTSIPGSSLWYDRGFITYSNASKIELLDVNPSLIEHHGAVSLEVAEAMAVGALHKSHATHAISITGIAGPGGATKDKPVGLVCFGLSTPSQRLTRSFVFSGERQAIRQQACQYAIQLLIETIAS